MNNFLKMPEGLKKNQSIAKFYGAEALTGNKRWRCFGEEARAKVLSSNLLTDNEKIEFLKSGSFLEKAEFWVNNNKVEISYFTRENLAREYTLLSSLIEKHWGKCVRGRLTSDSDTAREEIEQALSSNKFDLHPYFDFGVFALSVRSRRWLI